MITDAASAALTAEGVPHTVQWAGSMFSIFFREDPVRTYADARAQDTAAFGRFFHAMLDAGVHLPPSAFEAWIVWVRTTMRPWTSSPPPCRPRPERRRQPTDHGEHPAYRPRPAGIPKVHYW